MTNTVCEYQVFGEDSLNRFLNKVFIFCTNYVENHNIYFKGKNDIYWFINYIRPSFEHIGTDSNLQEIRNYKHNPFFKEYKEAIKIGQQILKDSLTILGAGNCVVLKPAESHPDLHPDPGRPDRRSAAAGRAEHRQWPRP